MKKTNFVTLSVAIASLLFISCSKDPENPPCTTSSAAIAGSYKVTAATYKASSTAAEIDYMNILYYDACERDDVLSFTANGNYTINDAGVVCSPSGSDSGNWSLSGSTMNIDGDLTTIESFDCKTLVLVNNDVNVSGDKLKITLTRQ